MAQPLMRYSRIVACSLAVAVLSAPSSAKQAPPGESTALGPRITQDMVQFDMTHKEARQQGLRIFSTPFNVYDGLGDGPMDPLNPTQPGGRPTLQNNGIFLRINGLDAQTCLECHSILSNTVIPAAFAVGGVGGASANAMPGIVDPDIDDTAGNGFAAITGRFINPPFSFGSGGVELLAREMTAELQALAEQAELQENVPVALETKGISFGSVVYANGELDTSGVVGVDPDLVIRPFGRKGCCATIREFDVGAMQFHHGIQPVEVVGQDVDADGDGVDNELTIGELSALHIFQISLERPREKGSNDEGEAMFDAIGCTECHVPELETTGRTLDLLYPDDPSDPAAEVYFTVDLADKPPKFQKTPANGLRVKLYADLKLHHMGTGLEESTGDPRDPFFTTARLWGVADTAPYLHDGRAPTLTDAILMHGGEAQAAADAFDALTDSEKIDLLGFLRTLRTPRRPSKDLDPVSAGVVGLSN